MDGRVPEPDNRTSDAHEQSAPAKGSAIYILPTIEREFE
jgi:hypothetical protein